MDKDERSHIEEVVNGASELKAEDLDWKPLYANNMLPGPVNGMYCLVLHENRDGTYAGRKYTIYYQLPVDKDGVIRRKEPELYILFEKCYSNLVNKNHPEPTNDFSDIIDEISKESVYNEELTHAEINDYGRFHRAYKDIEDAKKGAIRCYKAVFGYAMSHML